MCIYEKINWTIDRDKKPRLSYSFEQFLGFVAETAFSLFFVTSESQLANPCGGIDPKQRNNCGYFGIKRDECVNYRHCCWDDTVKDVPWCFFSSKKELLSLLQWKKLALLKGFLSRYSKRFQSHFWEHFYYWVAQMHGNMSSFFSCKITPLLEFFYCYF